jgi:hypothetical protein
LLQDPGRFAQEVIQGVTASVARFGQTSARSLVKVVANHGLPDRRPSVGDAFTVR